MNPQKPSEKRPYDREFEIRTLNLLNNSLLLIEGDVENSGANSWYPSKTNLKENEFRVGIKVFLRATDSLLLEERSIIPPSEIRPGVRVPFKFMLSHPDFIANEITLVLDILREGEHWFVDLGASPSRMSIKLKSEQGELPQLASEVYEVTMNRTSTNSIMVKGMVKNLGASVWRFSTEELLLRFQLGARAIDSAGRLVWEGRALCAESEIEYQQQSTFSLLIDSSFLDRSYILQIGMLIEGYAWFFELGEQLFRTPLTSARLIDPELPERVKFAVSVDDVDVVLCHGFLLRVTGNVTNTGTASWELEDDDSQARLLTIGALIYNSERTKLIFEGRGSLYMPTPLSSLESCPFSITLNFLEVPEGSYSIILDIVIEGEFWFHQKTGDSYSFPYSYQRPAIVESVANVARSRREIGSCTNLRVLYIAPTLPLFDRQSGGNRLLEILKILVEECGIVLFAYESPGILGDARLYTDTLNTLRISSREGVVELLSDLTIDSFDVCIIGWYECASKYLQMIQAVLPSAQLIIDTVDIHWHREARGKTTGALPVNDEELELRTRQEVELYEKADLLWTVTDEDSIELKSKIPQATTSIVSNIHHPISVDRSQHGPFTILFVGGFRHPPNESAALWGYEIVEKLRAEHSLDVTYFIVGDSPPETILSLHDGSKTIVTGYVPSLIPYYEKATVMIAPLLYGAGIKGKICHAVCAGVPVISTFVGIEGTGLQPMRHILQAESTEEFISTLSKLATGEINTTDMTRSALDQILLLTGVSRVRDQIRTSLIFKKVIIGIVSYNKLDLLKNCVTSLLKNTDYPFYQIAIVSNGCTDGTREFLLGLEREHPEKFILFFNERNDFYVRPNNSLMRAFPEYDIVLVNNDMIFEEPQWLRELYHGAYSSPLIGAAGGLVMSKERLVSEAGAELHRGGYGVNIGRGMSIDNPLLQKSRYVGYVSGCLLYMKRDCIDKFGMFDEAFHPMYYEDADWQYRMHLQGIKTLYVPGCRAIHLEGSSAGTDTSSGMKRFQEINRVKILNKFQGINFEEFNS